MNIAITLDYELFFGDNTGTLENCILKPTRELLKVLNPYNIKAVFFVDVGYIVALKRQKSQYKNLNEDFENIVKQIRSLSNEGHKIELHIHPHWEDCYFDGQKWVMDLSRYRIHSFSEDKIKGIVAEYCQTLKDITGVSPVAYRAGGWSAQPFSIIKKALETNDIYIDSTVYPGGIYESKYQKFDFSNIEQYTLPYNFNDTITEKFEHGNFLEIPISSYKVSPFFFWEFVYVKLRKKIKHKPFGDGSAVKLAKRKILNLLFFKSYTVVSIDGYKTRYLQKAFLEYKKHNNGQGYFVIIGHPKSFTEYSLFKLKKFIDKNHQSHRFVTLSK